MIDTTWLSGLIDDLERRHGELDFPAEGLRDLLSTNLEPPAREAANEELDWLNARRTMIEQVSSVAGALLQAIRLLDSDGYPTLRYRIVPAETWADLDAQRASITAALALFQVESPASDVTATVGPERPTKAARGR
jgi:hypothetical protein